MKTNLVSDLVSLFSLIFLLRLMSASSIRLFSLLKEAEAATTFSNSTTVIEIANCS